MGDDETVQINFKGDGPLGQITCLSDNTGMVKGMVANPAADPPLLSDGKLNVVWHTALQLETSVKSA